jgi:FixJ family two-component response regulator
MRSEGFDAETFASAEDFFVWPDRDRTSCLVLDVRLRGMSGFALLDRLEAAGVSIPTIVITAHDDPPTRERAQRAGAIEYFRKPVDEGRLIAAVHRAITR